MERKNTILLTVIAVATLLVAVVGATFAYFTATTGSTGAGESVEVTTNTIAGAVNLNLESAYTYNASQYPGGYAVAAISVTASDTDNANDYNVAYTLNGSVAQTLGTSVKWSLYRTTAAVENAVSGCTAKEDTSVAGETRYYMENCTVKTNELGTAVLTGTGADTVTLDAQTLSTKAGETGVYYYYLVAEYPNEGDQTSADSGKGFTVSLTSVTGVVSTQIANQ